MKKSFKTAIQDSTGKYTQSPQEINHVFYSYYSNLYTETDNPNKNDIHEFLNSLNMPVLTSEYRDIVDYDYQRITVCIR